jgi:hypothetical protein
MGKTFSFLCCIQPGCGVQRTLFSEENSQDMKLTTLLDLVLRLSVSRAVPPLLRILSRHAQRKPGWSHSMNYPSNCNEDHQLLQKLLRTCKCGWPDIQLSQHHKHIAIISNSSSGVWTTPDLFYLLGCWSVHLYLGQLMFLLPVGMYLCAFLGMHIGYS